MRRDLPHSSVLGVQGEIKEFAPHFLWQPFRLNPFQSATKDLFKNIEICTSLNIQFDTC